MVVLVKENGMGPVEAVGVAVTVVMIVLAIVGTVVLLVRELRT